MRRTKQFSDLVIAIAAVAVAVWTSPARAATCNVPSAPHPSIQAAINDVGCNPIIVAAGTYAETPVIARIVCVSVPGP